MKKFILFLITLCLIFGGFFYYKKHKNYDTKKKLTFWSIQLKPIYETELKNIIAEFEKKHPDYKIVWVDIPIQEAQKRTLASILSSNPPDLINLNPDFSILLAQKNALEFFKTEDVAQFNPNLVEKLKYEDKVYALPFYATSSVTIYNKKSFFNCSNDEKFPENYEQLYSFAMQNKNCNLGTIFTAALNENDTTAKILNKYNISFYLNNNEIQKTQKVYSMLNDMYKKGYFPIDILSINHREAVEKYMSNKTLSIVAGSNFINMIKQNAPEIYSESDISPQLTGESGKYDISMMNLIIPKKSANKALALEFALMLTNEQNQFNLAKKTNVIPANKYTILNEYFTNCSDDLIEKSRCISVKQLENIELNSFGDKNKKEINEVINTTLEEILLNKTADDKYIKNKVDILVNKIKILQK